MEWFGGNISDAIQASRARKVLFVVYVAGKDEMTTEMNESWDSPVVVEASKSTGIIAIKIEAESDTCAQFSAIFPVVIVPATYFIGNDGVPIDVVGGVKTSDDLAKTIRKISKDHDKKVKSQVSLTGSPGAAGGEPQPNEGAGASSSSPMAAAAAQPDVSVEERAKLVRERMDARRIHKAAEEKEKLKESEKERRELGKNLSKLKQKKDEQEVREVHDQMKKEREEDKIAKEKVREQIARDREERNRKFNQEKSEREKVKEETRIARLKAEQEEKEKKAAQRSTISCIQFRMADGSFITQQFAATDTLASAQQFVMESLSRGAGSFRMCMAYPRREFTQNDMSQSLADLGLAPSAAIMILPPARGLAVTPSTANTGIFGMILAPFFAVWNYVYSFFFGSSTSSTGSSKPGQDSKKQSSVQSNPRKRPASSSSRRDGNVHRLTREDDDDMNTWNGNSTQQM